MTVRGGYGSGVLRVDLDQRSTWVEPLPDEEVLRKYVGGAGLGLYYLLRDVPPEVEALDPEAPLNFMVGPLTGTPAVNSSDWSIVCYNVLIPYAAGIGHAHGHWGARLKHAGYEGILIVGRSKAPVYLWIDDGRVELRDASHLWGLTTRETERRVKAELGDETNISVACIGPAGEAQLPGAMVKADRNHGAGKGSPGAVMGSKNLKAIAVRGKGVVPLFDASGLVDTAAQWEKNIGLGPSAPGHDPGRQSVILQDGGITRIYEDQAKIGFTVGKNMSDPAWTTGFTSAYVEACKRWKVTPKPSYNCKVACAYDVEITDGPFAGFTGSPCGGSENMEGAAGVIGVDDPAAVVIMTDFFDSIGLESGQFGSILGAAYQAYNDGVLNLEDTDGLDLSWGNWESAMELIEMTIRREGIGAKLADGVKALPEALGREKGVVDQIRSRVLDVKGEGVIMHDLRHYWSAFFGAVIAGTGPSLQGEGSDLGPRPDLGIDDAPPGVAKSLDEALTKVGSVRRTQQAKLFWDTLGVCSFGLNGVKDSMVLTSRSLAQAVGWEGMDTREGFVVGERIANLMRVVYGRRGFHKSDEFDVSPRYLGITAEGTGSEKGIVEYLPDMVDDYYRRMGWDVDTGLPTLETLKRLGMTEFSDVAIV
jgi:aldehyde:ferredoxin oxidoreductase